MNAAQEFNDHGSGCGILRVAFAKEPVGQQQAKTGTGVGFNHEEDGFAGFSHLVHSHGSEDTVVDGVVQEQHFSRFNNDACEP